MSSIQVENEAQWHELRARNIGGSEIAALFDCSPFITKYSLWHEKAGNVGDLTVEDQRMRLGRYMEEYISMELGRELGWQVVRSKEYHLHPTVAGMGCTLDFDIVDHEWGPGICETKVVFDYADYKRDWTEERAPPNYELQVQHQLAVTGRSWAAIACMCMQTGSIQPAIIRRPNAGVIAEVEGRVSAFWESIALKQAPAPTGTETELSIMRHLWPARTPKKIARVNDGDLNTEASLLRMATEYLAGYERQRTASRAKLLAAAQDAELLQIPGFNIEIKQNRAGHIRMTVKDATNDFDDLDVPIVTTLSAG